MKALIIAALMGIGLINPVSASTFSEIRNASFELYQNGLPICSGTFISPTKFLTAGHCYTESTKEHPISYTVVTSDITAKKAFALKLEKYDKVLYDSTVFSLVDPQASFPYVDVAPYNYTPKIGDHVYLGSYPLVLDYFFLAEGIYTGVAKTPTILNGILSYVVSIPMASGSSGGGLYAEIDGTYKLIGNVTGGAPEFDLSFFSVLAGIYDAAGLDKGL